MEDAPDDWLVQIWFAGNHSDVGGSYAIPPFSRELSFPPSENLA